MTRTLTRLSTLLLLVTTLAACETVKGAGRDLETAGEALTDEAGEAQMEM